MIVFRRSKAKIALPLQLAVSLMTPYLTEEGIFR
jgi:hypothetical protein